MQLIDHRNVPPEVGRFEPFQQAEAGHAGHQHVEQNQIERLVGDEPECLVAVVSLENTMALLCEQIGEVFAIEAAVVHDQDVAALLGRGQFVHVAEQFSQAFFLFLRRGRGTLERDEFVQQSDNMIGSGFQTFQVGIEAFQPMFRGLIFPEPADADNVGGMAAQVVPQRLFARFVKLGRRRAGVEPLGNQLVQLPGACVDVSHGLDEAWRSVSRYRDLQRLDGAQQRFGRRRQLLARGGQPGAPDARAVLLFHHLPRASRA